MIPCCHYPRKALGPPRGAAAARRTFWQLPAHCVDAFTFYAGKSLCILGSSREATAKTADWVSGRVQQGSSHDFEATPVPSPQAVTGGEAGTLACRPVNCKALVQKEHQLVASEAEPREHGSQNTQLALLKVGLCPVDVWSWCKCKKAV